MAVSGFMPRNYPKSSVIFVIAILSGLASSGVAFLGGWLEVAPVETLGRIGFFAAWTVAALMFAVFLPNSWTGKYRDLPSRPWKEQVW